MPQWRILRDHRVLLRLRHRGGAWNQFGWEESEIRSPPDDNGAVRPGAATAWVGDHPCWILGGGLGGWALLVAVGRSADATLNAVAVALGVFAVQGIFDAVGGGWLMPPDGPEPGKGGGVFNDNYFSPPATIKTPH